MKLFRLFSILVIVAMATSLVYSPSLAQAPAQTLPDPSKIAASLTETFKTESIAEFYIIMAEQADVSGATALKTKEEKGTYVFNLLTETAARTQKGVIALLEKDGATYRSWYIMNMVSATGGFATVEALSARPDVARIVSAPQFLMDPIWRSMTQPEKIEAIEWNITRVGAPDVWAMGFTGEGMVLADNDTGADYTHPALVNKYRGNLGGGSFDHNYNWWDAWGGTPSPVPTDYDSHGTHTLGTMIGDDGGSNQIGVAPGAQWIACAGLNLECLQFFLAPTDLSGNNPLPEMAPDAINNSWYDPTGFDYRPVVQNLNAAGIAVIKSAGNNGPSCDTISNPGNVPEIIATAAFAQGDTIASFSSRGPSDDYGTTILKPEVAAPGVNVRSSVPGGGYDGTFSGTSMAAPHSTAMVALIWSAAPCLRGNVPLTKEIMMSTADAKIDAQCPPFVDHPNCVWGWGILDMEEAVTTAMGYCGGQGGIDGHVYNAVTSDPIEGATVTGIHEGGGSWSDDTDVTGYYTFTVFAGTLDVEATHPMYTTEIETDLVVVTDTVTTQNFYLQPRAHLYGNVTDQDSGAPLDAVVSVAGGPSTSTDPATGYYEFYLDPGVYDVTASAVDYADETYSVDLAIGEALEQDFTLLAAIAFVPDPIETAIEIGENGTVNASITNNMGDAYVFSLKEKPGLSGRLAGEDILVVRKDATAAAAMEAALTTLGVSFVGVTDAVFAAMTLPDVQAYSAVYYAGSTSGSTASENLLMSYLDAGGQLYISDNDLGYGRHGNPFYDTYLQATYVADNGGELLTGEDIFLGLDVDVTSDPYPDSFTVGAEGVRLFKWATSENAGGILVQRNGYQAVYTSFDFQQIADPADEVELIDRINSLFLTADVPWFGTSISTGTVPAGGTLNFTIVFSATTDAGIGQPGVYDALLKVVPEDPDQPDKVIAVEMTVEPSTDFGQISGTVTSDRPGGPLEGVEILIEGASVITLTTDASGVYSYWLEEGVYDVTASLDGYVSETVGVTIIGTQITVQNFELALDAPEIGVDPLSLSETLLFGDQETQLLTIENTGLQDLTWEINELSAGLVEANNILLMADDVVAGDWDVYRDALTAAGVTWDEWNIDTLTFPAPADLAAYDILIWADENVVDATDAQFQYVVDWINLGGKSLFVNGVDFLWDIQNGTVGLGEHNLYLLLNTTYVGDYSGTGITALNGVAGDPIGGDFTDPNGLTLAGTADSNADYAQLTSAATTSLIYGPGGTGSTYSGLTHYDGGTYKTVWMGVNFHNGLTDPDERALLMTNIMSFLGIGGDVEWLSETPTSGTVSPGDSVDVTVEFDASMVPEPGVYEASLRISHNDPLNETVSVPVTMIVTPSGDIGKLEGIVTSDRPGGALEADILIETTYGVTWTIPTDPDTGYYYKWLIGDTYTVTASAVGYIPEEVEVTITALMTTTQDFELVLIAPEISVTPTSLEETLEMGQSSIHTLDITNLGNAPLTFAITERNGDFIPEIAGEDVLVVAHDATSATAMEGALASLGYTYLRVTDAQFQAMTVDQLLEYLAVFHAGTTGTSATPSASEILIMAYLDEGGSLYISDNDLGYYRHDSAFYDTYLQADFQADNGGDIIEGLDIMAGLTVDISADPYPDSLLVNPEGTPIFQFQSAATYNGVSVDRLGYKAVYTAFDFQNIADPLQEIEVVSRVMDQIAAGEIPWLSEEPVTGTVPAGGMVTVDVTFDAGAASEPGLYTGELRIDHNDPFNFVVAVPVTLTVEPSADYGRLEGVVTSLGQCDVVPVPLEADVLIEAEDGTTWTVTSDPTTGEYFRWLLGGTYTVTASADLHLPETVVVVVTAAQTVVQDIDLRLDAPCLGYTPTGFSVSLGMDAQQTETLTISNDGAGELIWEVRETTRTVTASPVQIPAFNGTLPEDKTPVSFERAPAGIPAADPVEGVPIIDLAAAGFTMQLSNDTLYNLPDLDVPGTWTLVGAPGVTSAYAGDFGPDTDTLYMISDDTQSLYAVDAATGTATLIGSSSVGTKTWTGMAWDPTTQTMYGSATDGTTATLYTINLETGALTTVADISGAPLAIDIAIDETGQLYTVDIQLDALLAVDKATGATTQIGSIGFTANYAQGMDYDLENHIMYMAAYNYDGVSGVGELRVVDTTTGATQLIGTFPGGAEVDSFAVATGGVEPWIDVPWVTEVPTNGVIGPDSEFEVDVTFDTTGLTLGECYQANLGLLHNDESADSPLYIPLELCVTGEPGEIEIEPEELAITMTLEAGAVNSAMYIIHNVSVSGTLILDEISEDTPVDWLVLADLPTMPYALEPGESLPLPANLIAPLDVGTYVTTFTIYSNDSDEGEVTIRVTLIVTEQMFHLYLPIVNRETP